MKRFSYFLRAAAVFAALLAAVCLTGCSVSEAVDIYNDAVSAAGAVFITHDLLLKGEREFGRDRYVGSYEAEYDRFSGEECLFGGTSVARGGGYALSVSCTIASDSGEARLMLVRGADAPTALLDGGGQYSGEVDLSGGGCYLYIECDGFTGSVSLDVTDAD